MENPYSQLKPGDRVIWLRSPGRSILSGVKVEQITGEVIGTGKYRLRIRVYLHGQHRIVNVDPDNVLTASEVEEKF